MDSFLRRLQIEIKVRIRGNPSNLWPNIVVQYVYTSRMEWQMVKQDKIAELKVEAKLKVSL